VSGRGSDNFPNLGVRATGGTKTREYPEFGLSFQKTTYDALKYLNADDVVQMIGENAESRLHEKDNLCNAIQKMTIYKATYKEIYDDKGNNRHMVF
jgi:hypothetical protein